MNNVPLLSSSPLILSVDRQIDRSPLSVGSLSQSSDLVNLAVLKYSKFQNFQIEFSNSQLYGYPE